MNTYTITLGQVTNNGVVCTSPVVTLVGHAENTVVNCIDEVNGIYQVQSMDELSSGSLQFLVQCAECDDCPPQLISLSVCDDNSDCGDCEFCSASGFCESLCTSGQNCVNDKCVDCTSSNDCPHNQVCLNGACGCPDGSQPAADGRCKDCSTNEDCGSCEVCQDGNCLPKECADGVCDPISGSCIDCINSGDCGVNEVCVNGGCQCADGFVKINGVCVSVECQLDGDCPPCFQCSNNTCIPIVCPSGKTPVVVNGSCSCATECDPNNPICDDGSYCTPSEVDGEYGCIGCTGSCAEGCDYPCICDKNQEICVANNCSKTFCTDATDCGPGCGCKDSVCTPCASLGCPGVECDSVPGCTCQGGACLDSDSVDGGGGGTDCSISSDCGFGYTCQGGTCVSCDNFSCTSSTCAEKDGCQCLSGNCVGQDISDCTDTLTITKDDSACTLTGTLVKSECCSCSELSIVTKKLDGLAVSGDNIVLSFRTELRKGTFDTNNPTANPRLDDTSNPDIADNELPVSGTVKMTYRSRFAVYTVSYDSAGNEVRNYTGSTLSARSTKTSSFINVSYVDFAGSVPKIGHEIREGDTVKVVTEALISFELSSSMDFPNNCSYLPGTPISSYSIKSNEELSTLAIKGTGVNSLDCRLPMFKWYKSDTNSFDSNPFRTLYIDGDGTYTDILTDPIEDSLQPCKVYLLETDCNCDDSKTKRIVFCNPTDIDYTLESCNTKFTFGNFFAPCIVNTTAGIEYYVKAGSLNLTFTANSYPANKSYISTEPILSIEFGQVCDVDGECTKTYTPTPPITSTDVITECQGDGTFRASFLEYAGCKITKISLDNGNQYIGENVLTLPSGTYTANVSTECSCPPIEVTFTQQCCSDITTPECSKNCDGTVNGCTEEEGITYTDEAGNELASLKDYVLSVPASEGIIINATREGCALVPFTVPALSQSCCGSFDYEFRPYSTGDGGFLTIIGGDVSSIKVVPQSSEGGSPAVYAVPNDPREYYINGMVPGNAYDITINGILCDSITDVIETSACDLGMTVTNDCDLYAEVPVTDCMCGDIFYGVSIQETTLLTDTVLVEWRVSLRTNSLDTRRLNFTVGSQADIESFEYTSSPSDAFGYKEILGQTEVSLTSTTTGEPLDRIPFYVNFTTVELEDNCVYPERLRILYIQPNGTPLSNSSGGTHSAIDPLAKFPKFTWEADTLKLEEFKELKSEITQDTTVAGKQFLQQGRVYELSSVCDQCSSTETITYCCTPSITTEMKKCNTELFFLLKGAPGVYLIKYGQNGTEITLTDENKSYSTSFYTNANNPFTSTSLTWESAINAECSGTKTVTLQSSCTPTITPSACVGDLYSITLSGCSGAAYVVTVESGPVGIVISGNSITNIPKNSGVVLKAVDNLTGCSYILTEGVDWTDPCIVDCVDKAWTTSPLSFVEGTCVTTTYQDDGSISLTANDTSGTVDKYGVSTLLPSGSTVSDYDGPDYATATAYALTSGDTVASELTNGPGVVVVRFYQGSGDCYTAFVVQIPEVNCACQLDYTLTGTSATCTSITPNNDGRITLSGYTNVTHFGVSTEDSVVYDGPTTIATATAVSTDPEDLVVAIPNYNPNSAGSHTYIIRLFGTTDICYEDTSVTVLDNVCNCEGPNENSTGVFEIGICDELSGAPLDNGTISWKLATGETDANADRYHIISGPSFDTNLTYATATALPSSTGDSSTGITYLLKSDVPTSGGTYSFRVYGGDNTCFQDFTVVVPGTVCTANCDYLLCDGKANGYECNGPGTECINGSCVVTATCTSNPCTYSSFDSQGCVICANRPSGYVCGSSSECDGAGSCVEATGACCGYASTNLGCEEGITEADCAANNGTWQGIDSDCSDTYQELNNVQLLKLGENICTTTSTEHSFTLWRGMLRGGLTCSGCDCYGAEVDVTFTKNGTEIGTDSSLIGNSKCGLSTAIIDYYSLKVYEGETLSVGDEFTVTAQIRNATNGGCLVSGDTLQATVIITAEDITAYEECFPAEGPVFGACCTYTGCSQQLEGSCSGVFYAGQDCSEITCGFVPQDGTCCYYDYQEKASGCVSTTATGCASLGSQERYDTYYAGINVLCTYQNCSIVWDPPTGS